MPFPPHEYSDEYGLLAIGGDLSVSSLLEAYSNGIFPWPIPEIDLVPWFSPPQRGVIYPRELHISRSLERSVRKDKPTITFNRSFSMILQASREHHPDSWITDELAKAYQALFDKGYAYSVEAMVSGKLVGGLYGVHYRGLVTGESMFFYRTNGSKYALLGILLYLKKLHVELFDVQMVTETTKKFGAREIQRNEYLLNLSRLIKEPNIELPKEEYQLLELL